MLGGTDCSSAAAVVRKTVTERSRRVRWAKMRVSRARGRGRENSTTSLVVAIVRVGRGLPVAFVRAGLWKSDGAV